MNHHYRGDMNSAYKGRKSTLPNAGGLGVGPRLPLPILVLGLIAFVAIAACLTTSTFG